ncbi:MAG: acetoin utilization protein AcuC [Chloroflexi bacterium]|nr:acetoin utilization protein AcuC [Chloroflexota bacterium]
MTTRNPTAAYIYADTMSQHVLREDHPLRPVRLRYTYELLEAFGAFNGKTSLLVEPRFATEDELMTTHTPEYVDAVKRYNDGGSIQDGAQYGFTAQGDNPVFPGMYEAALLSTGASVQAAEMVADGTVRAAFNPSGGLHHAMTGHASGFCVFNDPAVAINALRRRGLRVVYVDIDAHHGDGVQAAFYGDDDVMTISLHESGRYLFPGTGEVDEVGTGKGRGYSVNVPLFPYTDDDVFLEAFDAVVPPLIDAFKPDVLATQLGIDTYMTDPLTHLALSTTGYVALVRRFGDMAYPWLAFGGGGYDVDAVARGWALAYGEMVGRQWPDSIPESVRHNLTRDVMRDAAPAPVDPELRTRTQAFAKTMVDAIKQGIFPLHGINT